MRMMDATAFDLPVITEGVVSTRHIIGQLINADRTTRRQRGF
jgi:hypothetical protein